MIYACVLWNGALEAFPLRRDALRKCASGTFLAQAGSGSDREKVPRERRMRWPHFIQNSIESTLKGPFLAEKLQIRSSDTSSVTFGDSFPSRGSLRKRQPD